jgi:hypothetical protein
MKKRLLKAATIAALASAIVGAEDRPLTKDKGKVSKAVSDEKSDRYSRATLDRIRASIGAQVAAQIAVRDAAEGAMRAPTAAEAAALNESRSGATASNAVSVPIGGTALKTDLSRLHYVIAVEGEDGTASMNPKTKTSVKAKEVNNAR